VRNWDVTLGTMCFHGNKRAMTVVLAGGSGAQSCQAAPWYLRCCLPPENSPRLREVLRHHLFQRENLSPPQGHMAGKGTHQDTSPAVFPIAMITN
jgi:hypothetical protein